LGGAGLTTAETTVDQDARYDSEDGVSAEFDADSGAESEDDEGLLGLEILDVGDDDEGGDDVEYDDTADDGILGGVF
jgi:hypothetical protein